MKVNAVVTVLSHGAPASPGIVVGVTDMGEFKPTLDLVTSSAQVLRGIPYDHPDVPIPVSWRDYDPADFATPEAAASSEGGQAENAGGVSEGGGALNPSTEPNASTPTA